MFLSLFPFAHEYSTRLSPASTDSLAVLRERERDAYITLCMYVYIYICIVYVCVHIYIYRYIHTFGYLL